MGVRGGLPHFADRSETRMSVAICLGEGVSLLPRGERSMHRWRMI